MRLSDKVIVGQLTECDRLLFKAYESFLRVEDTPTLQNLDFLSGWKNSAVFVNQPEYKNQGNLIQMDKNQWRKLAELVGAACRRRSGEVRDAAGALPQNSVW